MATTATLNVRMDAETKQDFVDFCEEVGISASSLMNMFAKTVIRNQQVPFAVTSQRIVGDAARYSHLFPTSEAELDVMLSAASNVPVENCVSAPEAFSSFERRMGW